VDVVVLTFPGHFFQTVLSLASIQKCYSPVDRWYIIIDDLAQGPWNTYQQDFENYLKHNVSWLSYELYRTSDIDRLDQCVAGWWRQQLIKLTLDQIVPGDRWFVVDGDVIFRSRFDVQGRVPISRRHDASSRWSQMCVNYVRGLLGTSQGILYDHDNAVITSPVPFRSLDKNVLQALRSHVEYRFREDFIDLHLAWFRDQTIVADIDPPTRWVMSEWELIECFRQIVQKEILPYQDIGSGYQIDVDITTLNPAAPVFLHSYLRDTEIGSQWFRDQGISVDTLIWKKSIEWYDVIEKQRSI
jgi:hypothetical protein